MAIPVDIDMSAELAALPKHSGYQVLPPRPPETAITLHYSGVVYKDRSRAAELAHIRSETREHLSRNWGDAKNPAYGDGLMYDLVVLSDGGIVKTRAKRQQLWHCGNKIGNRESWSLHVLLGPGQDLTPPQRASLFALSDALRDLSAIPRDRVVGHNEWPRSDGQCVPETTYHVHPPQSECPGPLIHAHLVAYRADSDGLPTPLPVIGVAPSIAVDTFLAVLRDHQAPFDASYFDLIGGRLYTLLAWLDIDPCFFLAMWLHEQGIDGIFGNSDVGRASRGPLNIKAYDPRALDERTMPRWPRVLWGGVWWNAYESWQLGCLHAAMHLKQLYGAAGLLTVEQIVPTFAPADDQNNVPGYIAAVRRDMAAMQARET